MESQSSNSSIVAVYDSSLSAGLDIAQYYLSNSVKGSTKQQVFLVFGISIEIHHFVSLHYFPIDIFSMTVFTIFDVISVVKMMWQNLEGTVNHWLHVFLL